MYRIVLSVAACLWSPVSFAQDSKAKSPAPLRDLIARADMQDLDGKKLGQIDRLNSIVDVVDDFQKQGNTQAGAAEGTAKSTP